MDAIHGKEFTVTGVKRAEKKRSAAPPFTTSTLQQEASRKLNMTPKRTMAIAQQLYEGVDVAGEGTLGLITYMRTDSLRLSDEAMAAAANFIKNRYGKDYYYGKFHVFKTKTSAQDAHVPSIKIFSSKLTLHIRWPKYQSISFSISPFNEYSELISFRIDWFISLPFKGLLGVFSNNTV